MMVEPHARAHALLLAHLSPAQKADFNRHGKFIVLGQARKHRPRRMYVLDRAGVSEIAAVEKDESYWWLIDYRIGDAFYEVLDDFCVVEEGFQVHSHSMPFYDLMLVWKFMIETDERRFRRLGHSA
jgi:hypothetical protein